MTAREAGTRQTPRMPLRVVVIAGAELVRTGMTAILSTGQLSLAGSAASAAEAEPLIASADPDVVLVDNELADGDGLAFGARLRQERPAIGIVLVAPRNDQLLVRALALGISAYVHKSASIEELLAAIRHAAVAPGSFTAPDLAGALVRHARHSTLLSPRETEVLSLAVQGFSAQRISTKLDVSESTVKTYLARVYGKLGVRTRAEALAAAARMGLR